VRKTRYLEPKEHAGRMEESLEFTKGSPEKISHTQRGRSSEGYQCVKHSSKKERLDYRQKVRRKKVEKKGGRE